MTECEQDAVKQLKKLLNDFDNQDITETDLWVINKLIEKQQKEIEKYKNVITNLNNNWISKEQIREKIKELEHKDFIAMQVVWKHDKEAQIQVQVLRELLED